MHRPNWKDWHHHFRRNADRALPEPSPIDLPLDARREVARSLAVFQRGESGEGRIAKEIHNVELDGIDDDYRRALGLFVAEEGRHARILALVVRTLDGELLANTWTDRLFVRARRLAGIRAKLLVLLVAEIIGITFYAIIARGLPPSAIRLALEEIVTDERAHLAFHVDFFRTQTVHPVSNALFRMAWMLVGTAACWVVAFDHRRTLRALSISSASARDQFRAVLDEVARTIVLSGRVQRCES